MPRLVHKTPCNQCPFRQASAPGWLGAATPYEFVDGTIAGEKMPCHSAIDYDRADWKSQVERGPYCAGSLIFLKNMCKMPHDPDHAEARRQVEVDHQTVFSGRHQFLLHHDRGYGYKDET